MSDEEDNYKIVVLVPRKIGEDWIHKFFAEIGDCAYEVQDMYDADNKDRDWDIFCYGTPEKDDK